MKTLRQAGSSLSNLLSFSEGWRKYALMIGATVLLVMGHINQDVWKWVIGAMGLATGIEKIGR